MNNSVNPNFRQSKENFDIMSEIIEETIKELSYTYNKHFKNLEKTTEKLEKDKLLIKLDKLNTLNRKLKDYKASVNNCMEQYYFLFLQEKKNKDDWKTKFYTLKKYASEKGIDTALINWL